MRSAEDVASDLALTLGGEVLGSQIAIGHREGYRVRCQIIGGLTSNDQRDGDASIEIRLHTRRALELWVARGNPTREAVAHGDAVDIEVGQPAFDELFHVEGAPVDVVRVLFDAPLCGRLGRLPSPELSTVRVDDEPVVRLRISTWSEPAVLEAVAVLIQIASRLDEAYEVADAVHTHHGSPFRNEITPRARIDASRATDFEALAAARRSTWWRRFRRRVASFVRRGD